MNKVEMLKRQLEELKQQLKSIKYIDDDPELYNYLYTQIYRLSDIYKIVSKDKINSNDELDIYEQRKDKNTSIYHIVLHDDIKIVGCIKVTYDEGNNMYGNIGYEIKHTYRGNNYALKALELLEETMIQRGLTNPQLTVFPNNVPSIKTIEKFGGELIAIENGRKTYHRYQVDLITKQKNTPKTKKML